MKRLAKIYAFVVLAYLGLLSVPVAGGDASPPKEYELKAAFLFNFAKFTDWPSEAFANTNSPIVIGVLGTNVSNPKLIAELEGTLLGKTINNRQLQVRALTEATNSSCHMLFILASEEIRLQGIFAALGGSPVLTVGETEGFTKANGMINFVLEDNKIRFRINNDAARKANLKISSKLLSLALRP